jgi:hypothetical protein
MFNFFATNESRGKELVDLLHYKIMNSMKILWVRWFIDDTFIKSTKDVIVWFFATIELWKEEEQLRI